MGVVVSRMYLRLSVLIALNIFSLLASAGEPPTPSHLAWVINSGALNCTWKPKKVEGWKVSINGPRGFVPVAGIRIDSGQNWYTVGQASDLPNGSYKCIVRSIKYNQESEDKKKNYTLTTGKPVATPHPTNPTPTATAVPTPITAPTATPNANCINDFAAYQFGKSCCSGYSGKFQRDQPMGPPLPTRYCLPAGFQCPAVDQVAPLIPGESSPYCCENQRLKFLSRSGESGSYYCKDENFNCPKQPDGAGFCCGKAFEIVTWSFDGGRCKLGTDVSYGCGITSNSGQTSIYVPPGYTLSDPALRRNLACTNPGDCYGVKVCK